MKKISSLQKSKHIQFDKTAREKQIRQHYKMTPEVLEKMYKKAFQRGQIH